MRLVLLKKSRQANKKRELGQSLPEYGLILALITIVCIGIMILTGGNLKRVFTDVNNALPQVETQ
jgi:Flp pilus assembly pilin Flp